MSAKGDFWTDAVQDMNKKLDKAEARIAEFARREDELNAEIKTLYDVLGVHSKSEMKRLTAMLKSRDEEIERLINAVSEWETKAIE